MDQEIRFCRAADGVRLAYATAGEGPPLVKAANWLNHLEFDWQSPIWRHLLEEMARDHLLVRYDERGNGLSDWEVDDISFDAFVADLECVIDAAGLDRFALLGISQGCAVSIAYAVRYPERVTHLVLLGGYAKGWLKRSTEEIERRRALGTLMKQGWGQGNPAFRQLFTTLFVPDATSEQMDWFNELQRVTTSPEIAIRLSKANGLIDVTDLLSKVTVPTLVLHSRNEAVVDFELGRELATGIPSARFVPLESRNHLILAQEPAFPKFVAEVRRFLGAPPSSAVAEVDRKEWGHIDELLDAALVLPRERRKSWLEHACPDMELRARIERLLELGEGEGDGLRAGGALTGPVWDEVARKLDLESRELEKGSRVGSYEILGLLGRGGMGNVYRARHLSLDREVAVKALLDTLDEDPSAQRRFDREAKLLASLNHPNIAMVHDLVRVEEKSYLVLEFVEGDTLHDRLREGPLGLEEALSAANQIARALEEAHKNGIIHRDLKPANVKLSKKGQVKVLDFGLAKSLWPLGGKTESLHEKPTEAPTTQAGMVLGTPGYMGPEQVRGQPVDERTDIWAYGCLVYEMLTGVPAFGGETTLDVVASILRDDVNWDHIPVRTPKPLTESLQRCLEKDPERRFQSVSDLLAELENAVL